MPWQDYEDRFPRSKPREAKGGIKARSKRGAFATNWWGRRWIAALESFGLGSRLTRGRSYARRGQVVDLAVAAGQVTARVQGSRPDPYSVAIGLAEIGAPAWRRIGAAIAGNMALAARVLEGELPPELEPCFTEAGTPLFPARASDLTTGCSCPDSANPCKHIAAVYYLLAEEFDRDPFLLFRLRGKQRDEFVALLGGQETAGLPFAAGRARQREKPRRAEPLAADPRRFWRGSALPDDAPGDLATPGEAAPLAQRLGGFPLWRGEADFLEVVSGLSRAAAERSIEILLERKDRAPPPQAAASAPRAARTRRKP